VYPLLSRLRDVMWEQVGLIRAGDGLREAIGALEDLAARVDAAAVPGGLAYNLAWQDWLNLRSQVATAWLIARSALARTESRGSHYRRDHPEPGSDLYTVLVGYAGGPAPRVWTEPVKLTRLTPAGVRPSATIEVGD
jgi:succinate dehydrogenase/fumarate reductase flavoprotein subunit